MSRRVSWRASLWEVWLDTAPQRETAAILHCGPLLLACQLNVKDRSTNYGTPAYGQKRIPSSNDGPCQLHACPGQRHMVFTAKKKKEKKLLQLLPPPSLMAVHLQPGWDAESGCLPGFSSPLSSQERGVGDPAVFAPAQRFPRGQLQQQTPEMKTTRPGHRCDTLVACDV